MDPKGLGGILMFCLIGRFQTAILHILLLSSLLQESLGGGGG